MPWTRVPGSTSRSTIAPAAMTAPAPIESPLATVAPMPTKTSSPIFRIAADVCARVEHRECANLDAMPDERAARDEGAAADDGRRADHRERPDRRAVLHEHVGREHGARAHDRARRPAASGQPLPAGPPVAAEPQNDRSAGARASRAADVEAVPGRPDPRLVEQLDEPHNPVPGRARPVGDLHGEAAGACDEDVQDGHLVPRVRGTHGSATLNRADALGWRSCDDALVRVRLPPNTLVARTGDAPRSRGGHRRRTGVRARDPTFIDDPYPTLNALREAVPVH